MEAQINIMDPLLERAEEYGKSSLELVRLKSADKSADIVSALTSRLLLYTVFGFFTFSLSVAGGYWLGDLFGKVYQGFLAVATIYAIAAIILMIMQSAIKRKVYNSVITQLMD